MKLSNSIVPMVRKRFMQLVGKLLLMISVIALVACGGGGGGDSGNPAPTLYSLTGTLRAPALAISDWDVNDPNAGYRSNDSMAEAQSVNSPATVVGYANSPGHGPTGRSRANGDIADYYRVQLSAGETVAMLVANPTEGDLDMRLRDASGLVMDASLGIGAHELVRAPSAGTYFVEVYPFSGASAYLLAFGQGDVYASNDELRLSSDFVPGEAVVRYRVSEQAAALHSDGRLHAQGFSVAAGHAHEEMRLVLSDAGMGYRIQAYAPGALSAPALQFASEEMRAKWDTLMAIKMLQQDSAIDYAEPNYLVQLSPVSPMHVPNDPGYRHQWHYPMIDLPSAWDTTRGDSSVIVAVVDTGVLLSHPDLQGQLVGGYDFISDPAISLDGDGIDPNPDDPGDGYPRGGSSFHGTHVAGTVAAASNNGIGVAGVAPDVRIMPIRVLGARGMGTGYDVRQGVRYAAGLSNDSGRLPPRRADIINLSLGGPQGSQADAALYAEVRRRGVIVVASAGNENSSTPNYPAAYPEVISVSAVGLDGRRASYSSFGSTVAVAAPGGDNTDLNQDGYVDGVLSTWGDDSRGFIQMSYSFMMGTSMAAPHVAGVIALMKSVNPSLTPADVDRMLAAGQLTRDIGPPGRDKQYGYGLIDAAMAVAAARGGANPPVTPTVTAEPASLQFSAGESMRDFTLSDNIGGTIEVRSISVNVPWLQVTASATSSNGLGRYRASINRAGLTPGTHRAIITVATGANTLQIAVTTLVADNAAVGGDAGVVYVVLRDPRNGAAVSSVRASFIRGDYVFRFDNVREGEYQIFAGTDHGNTGRICKTGDVCGWYGSPGEPRSINVNRNLSALEFTTAFRLPGDLQPQANETNRGDDR
jgi:serine protease